MLVILVTLRTLPELKGSWVRIVSQIVSIATKCAIVEPLDLSSTTISTSASPTFFALDVFFVYERTQRMQPWTIQHQLNIHKDCQVHEINKRCVDCEWMHFATNKLANGKVETTGEAQNIHHHRSCTDSGHPGTRRKRWSRAWWRCGTGCL